MWPSTSGEFTQVFCKRVECPSGWVQEGPFGTDQGGCGLEGCGARYGSSADSPESCAAHCEANAQCKAFNWAPMDGDRNHGGNRVCTIYSSATTNQMWPSTSREFTQIFCKPAGPDWTIGEDLSGSCDSVCGAVGKTCSQADLDSLAFSSSSKQPDAAKSAYESASPASLTCNNWNTGCSGGNCPNWGLPFIHKSHFNDNLCWGGDAAAACGQNPVDGHHRRLCPCSMPVPAVCPSGWVQEGPLGTDQGGCGLEGCGARYGSSADSPESCAAHCDANAQCKAFNWAPMNGDRNHGGNRVCTIYNSATTNQMWPSTTGEFTQVFCKRVECPSGWVQEGPFGTDQGGCGLEGCGARYGSSA